MIFWGWPLIFMEALNMKCYETKSPIDLTASCLQVSSDVQTSSINPSKRVGTCFFVLRATSAPPENTQIEIGWQKTIRFCFQNYHPKTLGSTPKNPGCNRHHQDDITFLSRESQ